MTKSLSDTQRVILAHAATRDDGQIFPVPTTLNKNSGAITLSLRPLVDGGLVVQIPAAKGDTTWGQTADDVPTTLAISELGLAAIGIQPSEPGQAAEAAAQVSTVKHPSPTSKLGMLITCLTKPDGATLDELVAATGWQKHSVRGAISGALKVKHELTVLSEVIDGKGRVYRIVSQTGTAAELSDAATSAATEVVAQP
jgi:hypothetical protein